jgi:mevalonate kinase
MLKKLSLFIETSERTEDKTKSSKSKISDSFDFLALIKAWPEIAGPKLSEHTIPLKNQNGTLIILSNHSAFANELSYMELPLKKKIFDKFPKLEKNILNIKFIVDSTYFSKQYDQFVTSSEQKRTQNNLHPLSPEYRKLKKEAEVLFSDVADEEMKAQLSSLYIQSKRK